MPDDPCDPAKKPPPAEVSLENPGEFVVEHHPIPPKGPADKRIHPRRPLPLVPNRPGKQDASRDE